MEQLGSRGDRGGGLIERLRYLRKAVSSSLKVMIVEDDALIALRLADALSEDGFEVCGVFSEEGEAIAAARTLRPEFAVVDVRLSVGDGRNVARMLTNECDVVVLMATAEDRASLDGLEAAAMLAKPFDPSMVGAALIVAAIWSAGFQTEQLPYKLFPLAEKR